MREAYAGVSCRALYDGTPWFQQPEIFGVLDEEEGGAVFYGAAGVLEFGFAEDVAAGFFGEAL